MTTPTPDAVRRGRFCLVLAALLWSVGSLFTRLLTNETSLHLHEPTLTPLQISFFRSLFAGLMFLPLLRGRDLTFRPLMLLMVGCFAIMNATYLSAMALGPAANAILLQNTAPFWVYLICVYFFRESSDRRSWEAILIGMAGVAVIIAGGWIRDGFGRFEITAMGLASGFMYSGVILCLRALRDHSPEWLTTQNHLGSAICLAGAILVLNGPVFWWAWITTPSPRQIGFLAFFGVVQMGLPYLLFTRGLRSVSPQEAGTITLLEPILNPLWAYLISPETDTPPPTTWLGGSLILAALAWRYAPRKRPGI